MTPGRVGRLAIATAIALATLACSGTDASDGPDRTEGETTTTPPAPAGPTFERGPCEVVVPGDRPVECGTVDVPVRHEQPDGPTLRLAVVVIRSTADDVAPDPVVYLHGGPGSGRLDQGFAAIGANRFLERRDLIFFDQRGTGRSTPDLNCPERELAFVAVLTRTLPFEDELRLVGDAVAACHDRLRADGVDLDAFDSVQNAQDLGVLREALGVREWNLWGASYGTRLALEALRHHPEGVRSVILDSVYPTTAGGGDPVESGRRAFAALAAGCAADPVCDTANPDVEATLERAARAMDRQPYAFTWQRPDGPVELELGGDDLVGGLFNALYDTALVPLLPGAITSMSVGDRTLVPLVADTGIPFINDATEGAFFSVECADNAARMDRARIDELRREPGRAGLLMLSTWQPFCDRWPVDPLPATFGEPVRSDVPALVVAGEYDPITPPADSRGAAEALGNATFVQVPRGGHTPLFDTECTTEIALRFLERPGPVDTACMAGIEPQPFT